MITPYYRPQDRIFQNLRNTATNAVKRQGALLIGPQYLLALNDGRELPASVFSSTGEALLYRHIENGVTAAVNLITHKVKTDSVRLFGQNLEATVATNISSASLETGSTNSLRSTSNFAGTTGLDAALGGRQVQVGDLFVVRADNAGGAYVTADTTNYRKVRSLLPKIVPSSVAAVSAAASNAVDNSTAISTANTQIVATSTTSGAYTVTAAPTIGAAALQKLLEIGGRFNGKVGEEITLVCTTGGPRGTAVFRASYTTLGAQENVTPTGVDPALSFTFPALGGAVVALNHVGSMSQGDTIRLILYPVHTANAASMFSVLNPTAYTGSVSTAYVIEVVKGGDNVTGTLAAGTQLRIYDTGGLEPVQTVNVTTTIASAPLGTRGLNFAMNATTPAADLVTGDKFIFAVTASSLSPNEFNGVVLDGPAVNPGAYDTVTGRLQIDVRQVFTGEITGANSVGGTPFVAGSNSVTYEAGLGVMVAKTVPTLAAFVTGRGTIKVEFKAAVKPGLLEGPIKVSSRAALVAGQLGELNIANDLAYGAYQMLSGAGSTQIHVLRTAADTQEAYEDALKKIRGVDVHYALVPTTDDIEIANFVALHCEEMSAPEVMNFRRCYFGTDSPGQYTLWDTLPNGSYRRATLVGDLVEVHPDDAAVSNFTSSVTPTYVGDIIRFLSMGTDLIVTEVVSSTSVRVSGAPPTGVAVASSFQLIKPDTADNTIDYVIARSLSVANRRAVNVWCDRPITIVNGESVLMPMKYVAAEIGGLRSVLKPQQGLTMTEITTIHEAPAMFARFTPEQLDRAAAAGVMIVTQEIEGGEIFIRHQLTTQTNNGALQYEDSPGVVVDAFSFRIKDKFRGYLGKKNVTPATIAEVYSDLKQLAIDASQVENASTDESIGALILGFSDEAGTEGEVTVEVDGDLADKLRTFVNLRVALPLNGLTHYVDASASVTI